MEEIYDAIEKFGPWSLVIAVLLVALRAIKYFSEIYKNTADEKTIENISTLIFGSANRAVNSWKEKVTQEQILEDATGGFVGRESDLVDFERLFFEKRKRFITVIGAAGVGKTRFVQQFITKHRSRFNLHQIDLEECRSFEDVETNFKSTIESEGVNTSLEKFAEDIQQPTLLVLDNFEQLVSNSVEKNKVYVKLLKPFIKSRLVQIIVTSRRVIGFDVSMDFMLSPLSLEAPDLRCSDAVKMFLLKHDEHAELKSLVCKEFANQDIPLIANLCSRVSCLPLGIRMLASRSCELSLQEIEESMTSLITEGSGEISLNAITNRQDSLALAFEWSFNLLSDFEKRLLVGFMEFSNGQFSDQLPAAPYLKSQLATKLAARSLCANSLVRVMNYPGCSEPKYELYTFVKEVLQWKIDNGEIERDTEYGLVVSESILADLKRLHSSLSSGDDVSEKSREIGRVKYSLENYIFQIKQNTSEHPELAAELLIFTEMVLQETGPHLAIAHLFDPLLVLPIQPNLHVQLLLGKSLSLKSGQQRKQALQEVLRAVEMSRKNEVLEEVYLKCLQVAIYISAESEKHEIVSELIKEFDKIIIESERDYLRFAGLVNKERARYFEHLDDYESARMAFSQSLDQLKGFPADFARAQNGFGLLCWRTGYSSEAEKAFMRAIEVCDKIGLQRWRLGYSTNLGMLLVDAGDYDRASEVTLSANELLKNEGPYEWFLINKGVLERIAIRKGQTEEYINNAIDALKELVKEFRLIGYEESMILSLNDMAYGYMRIRNYEPALECVVEVLAICESKPFLYKRRLLHALLMKALILFALNNEEEAKIVANQTLSKIESTPKQNWELAYPYFRILMDEAREI